MPYKHVDAAAEMVGIAKANSCGTMVVGLPLTPGGSLEDRETDSQVGRRCRNFAQTLAMVAKQHGIHVYIVSERYSTMEAEELLIQSKRNKRAVKVSCAIWSCDCCRPSCPPDGGQHAGAARCNICSGDPGNILPRQRCSCTDHVCVWLEIFC